MPRRRPFGTVYRRRKRGRKKDGTKRTGHHPGGYVRYRRDGQEVTRYAGPDRVSAEAYAERLRRRFERAKSLGEPPVPEIRFEHYAEEYLAFSRRDHSPSTARTRINLVQGKLVLIAVSAARPRLAAEATQSLYGVLGDGLLDAALGAGMLPKHETLREVLAARAEAPDRRQRDRDADAEILLRDSIAAGDIARGERALEILENLSDDAAGRKRLLAILEDRSRYDPVWQADEALYARVRLLEAEGRGAAGRRCRLSSTSRDGRRTGDGTSRQSRNACAPRTPSSSCGLFAPCSDGRFARSAASTGCPGFRVRGTAG